MLQAGPVERQFLIMFVRGKLKISIRWDSPWTADPPTILIPLYYSEPLIPLRQLPNRARLVPNHFEWKIILRVFSRLCSTPIKKYKIEI